MARWTTEQQQAIDEEGKNIIVSAGAGSGKTAVLTARTLRKLRTGVHVDELLILTFTKAAAFEMMMRIRSGIEKEKELSEELKRIDSAYITTFDSYALSIVKKYHYLLNISKEVKIIDTATISIEKQKMLDQILEKYYEEKNPLFLQFIGDFCTKEDSEIREFLLSLNNKIDMKYDKLEYLKNYLESSFAPEKIDADIVHFECLLKAKLGSLRELMEEIAEYVDGTYYEKLESLLLPLFSSENYDDIKSCIDQKLPMLPKGMEEEVKVLKEKLASSLKEVKEILVFSSREEIRETILSTREYVDVIIKILLELDERLYQYKYQKDVYEFVDISKMAITIVRDHLDVREEIKQSFNEIMIDEYQDTNDLQEVFISYIAKDNVYMVGDIKQSIYRFRNANPYIFKQKYDCYKEHHDGIKIDLVKNFRSRDKVLDNINYIFDKIMDDKIGGAEYQESHRMIFGNQTYVNEGKTDQNYDFEVYRYERDKSSRFSKEETEIFIIADDIQKKIEDQFQIFDKDTLVCRPVTYSDFVILMDRSTHFDLYKKIFESKGIPLTIYKDESITDQNDIYLMNHILKLLIGWKLKNFDETFSYSFIGVARSYLFEMKDEEIFDIVTEKKFSETTIIQLLNSISLKLDALPIAEIMKQILHVFPFYEKLITVGNVASSMTRLEYLLTLGEGMQELGYSIYEFSEYFEWMIKNNQMQYSLNKEESESCKIMTIHKSKGLEFPICYYSGLYAKFNTSDLKEKFTFDPYYGIIVPYFKEGIGETIYKPLLKEKYLEEEISEKIRLFYVALTRSKEKMILITPLEEAYEKKDKRGVVEESVRKKYQSFTQILNSIYEDLLPYIKEIDLKKVPMSKDYLLVRAKDFKKMIPISKQKIKEEQIKIKTVEIKEEIFSKKVPELLNYKIAKNIEFGKNLHYAFEMVDLKNPSLEELPLTRFCKEKLEVFLQQKILQNLENTTIYKEYEFQTTEKGKRKHGVIDLMIEHEDYIDLIDYKLQNVEDKNYLKQLTGYSEYIQNKTGKTVNIYLYSILNGKMIQKKR